ncbi:hypothetical protein P3G55_04800 [Leptospira sp. 96542]|nr:hypothetical protein [Leptospira sp. 96542]
MNTQVLKIKEYSKQLAEIIRVWVVEFYKIATGETKLTRDFLFLFFSWFGLLIFFSFFMLAEQNPFRLFIPFQVYTLPSLDHREPVTVFISNGEGEEFPIKRKVLKMEGDREFVYQLVGEVGSPPYFEMSESNAQDTKLFSPKKLLDIRFALKQVWFLESNTRLVLDWNVETIELVMEKYRLPKLNGLDSDSETEDDNASTPVDTITYYSGNAEMTPRESEEVVTKRRFAALNSTLRALNETLFENFPNLKRIEHKLSGERHLALDWDEIPSEAVKP